MAVAKLSRLNLDVAFNSGLMAQFRGSATLRQVATALNNRGIEPARGGCWAATHVWDNLNRAA